jgi:microcystin-dependent protein
MTLYKWSQTASADATADSTINWSEGQAPSSINDSARAMMAATAKFRDDIAGAILTGGTSTSYTVTSYQQFDSLARLSGQVIAFTPHVTSTGSQCLLNVDGLGTKTVRLGTGIDVPAGTLIQGTPYEAVYNNLDGVFYLKGFYGSPYLIPLGATLDYWAPTAPNSTFVFPVGQAISRVTYATLFALMGTTHGTGDGSSTFNLPDLRGRVVASPDNMGGTDASRLSGSGITSLRNTLGGTGGEGSHVLTIGEMPSHNHSATAIDSGHSHSFNPSAQILVSGQGGGGIGGGGSFGLPGGASIGGGQANISVSVNSNGAGNAHNVVQPTILGNRIMRII